MPEHGRGEQDAEVQGVGDTPTNAAPSALASLCWAFGTCMLSITCGGESDFQGAHALSARRPEVLIAATPSFEGLGACLACAGPGSTLPQIQTVLPPISRARPAPASPAGLLPCFKDFCLCLEDFLGVHLTRRQTRRSERVRRATTMNP